MENLDSLIVQLKECRPLSEQQVRTLCAQVREIFVEEPNVLPLTGPVTVSGDIKGHFHDLLEVFRLGGECPETKYVFLGNYVDNGKNSIECLSLLLALKLKYRYNMTLLRGNHECRDITQVYGFHEECVAKYNEEVYNIFLDLFHQLPLAAIIEDRILCIHGGLSPDIQTIDDITQLNRRQEIPTQGPLCDLLWSDPADNLGWGESPRGAGREFGQDITEQFMQQNGLTKIIRGHQLKMKGYDESHGERVVTLFTAADYHLKIGNQGAFVKVAQNLSLSFIQFTNPATVTNNNDDNNNNNNVNNNNNNNNNV